MAYFPFFVDLEGQEGLIVGAGRMALHKIQKLMPYAPKLTVIAPVICDEISEIPGLTLIEDEFNEEYLEGKSFAIAASDQPAVNRNVYLQGKLRNILVNSVDDKDNCSFIFPSLIKCGPLSIGISTSGASPSVAKWVKDRINEILPRNIGEVLREEMQNRERRIPTDEEIRKLLEALGDEDE